ncbi:MAG: IclR family transcriptional regulator [Chloroflexota bacterium]
MTDKKSSPSYRVPALEKGLDVLEVLSAASEPLSLSQLAEMTDRTTSELFRTLNCLAERDYVAKDDFSGKYQLTLKLFELAHQHAPLDHLLQAAHVPMQELARTLKESCHLSVIRNNRLLVLAEAESPNTVRISVSVGASFSLVSTVSGRMLLSALHDDEVEEVLAQDETYAGMTPEERTIFHERLQLTRETGISRAADETYIGLQDVAVLVGSPAAGAMAALAVTRLTASKKQGDTRRIQDALVACAHVINQRGGFAHPHILPS